MKLIKKISVPLTISLIIALTATIIDLKIKLRDTESNLLIVESALSKTKAALVRITGLIWRGKAPVNEWSEEILINGSPFHLWSGMKHRHYKVMINGEIHPDPIEEGNSSFDFPQNVQTLRLMTVEENEPIYFEIPPY